MLRAVSSVRANQCTFNASDSSLKTGGGCLCMVCVRRFDTNSIFFMHPIICASKLAKPPQMALDIDIRCTRAPSGDCGTPLDAMRTNACDDEANLPLKARRKLKLNSFINQTSV